MESRKFDKEPKKKIERCVIGSKEWYKIMFSDCPNEVDKIISAIEKHKEKSKRDLSEDRGLISKEYTFELRTSLTNDDKKRVRDILEDFANERYGEGNYFLTGKLYKRRWDSFELRWPSEEDYADKIRLTKRKLIVEFIRKYFETEPDSESEESGLEKQAREVFKSIERELFQNESVTQTESYQYKEGL